MKKKILASIFVFVLTLTALTATVFAERKRELPVNMERQMFSKVYKMTLESFEVTDVEHIPEKKINKIRYKLNYTEQTEDVALWLQMKCFDKNSVHIDTVDIYDFKSSYAEVPENTAKIEIVLEDATYRSDSYYYSRYMEVYSADGRTKTISELLLPVYEKVGWSAGVKMYALDGRTKYVKPSKVAANEAVGWYTEEGFAYYKLQNAYNEYKAVGDYNSILELVYDYTEVLEDTKYEQNLYAIRTEVMSLWRKATGEPVGVISYEVNKNENGVPVAAIAFRNISEKKIVEFKTIFTCYNKDGKIENPYYNNFVANDIDLDVAECDYYFWDFDKSYNVNSIKNIRINEVTFEDGTKWKR